jgi:hypothetical protein
LVGLAGTLAFAGPAFAAGGAPGPATTPFPTTICGTASPSASASSSVSIAAPTHERPSASARPFRTPAKPGGAPSTSDAAAGATAAPSARPSPSPSPSGGLWGILNGVWQWIGGPSQPPPHTVAPTSGGERPSRRAGPATGPAKVVQSAVNQGASELGHAIQGTPIPASASAAPSAAGPSPTRACLSAEAAGKSPAVSNNDTAAEIPWHLMTPSMTMYNLTYNGVTAFRTENGSERVLDFTATKVTLLSMVTFSHQGGGKLQFVDGGPGGTVTLTDVHLWTTSLTADVLGLVHVTLTPDSTPTALLGLAQGLTVPLPLQFTHVDADNAFLSTRLIDIPGFDGHGR